MISYDEMVQAISQGQCLHLPEIRDKSTGTVLFPGGMVTSLGGLPHPSLLSVGTPEGAVSAADLQKEIQEKQALLEQVLAANARADAEAKARAEAKAAADAAQNSPVLQSAPAGPTFDYDKLSVEELTDLASGGDAKAREILEGRDQDGGKKKGK